MARQTNGAGSFLATEDGSFEREKKKLLGWHQNGLTIACEQTCPKAFLTDHLVIVTRIAGPAGHKFERRLPGIGDAMSYVSRNIVNASRSHRLRPSPPSSVHHNDHPSSYDATVVLCAVALDVEMTARHEIFVSDSARLDHCCTPKQAAWSSFRDRCVPMNSVNDCIQIHPLQIVTTVKEPLHLLQCFHGLANIMADKVTADPVNMGNFSKILRLHKGDGSRWHVGNQQKYQPQSTS